MNKKILLLSLAAAAILSAACVVLSVQLVSLRRIDRAQAAALQAEAAARAAQAEHLATARSEQTRIEKQNQELAALAHQLRASEAKQASNALALKDRLQISATNATGLAAMFGGGEGMSDMMEKMMSNPAMKEMLRSQQKAAMKSTYGPLFKDLNLTADQQTKLTDLILESQLAGMDSVGDLFKQGSEAQTNAIQSLTDRHQALEDEIKALLGEEKFAQYEEYQETMADRTTLKEFQDQLAGTDLALQAEQVKNLIQLMQEERAKVPPVISDDPTRVSTDLAKVLQDESMEQQIRWQEDLNRRVLERAAKMLTPEQLQEFTEFQEQQLNMEKIGLKMAREMFGSGRTSAGDVKIFVQPAR